MALGPGAAFGPAPFGPGAFGPAELQQMRDREAARRISELPPDDREAFARNLKRWRELAPEEREALRKQATVRMHAEIDKALQESGLHLDADQREVFSLRYTQERRKLERDIERNAAAERAKRMPEIMARLKAEFGGGGKPVPAASATGTAASEAR